MQRTEASRVRTVGLTRDDVGGVFLPAPSALCGFPAQIWGRTGGSISPSSGHLASPSIGPPFVRHSNDFGLAGWHLRDGAEIMSRFIPACMIAPARAYFSISITHCLKHLAA